VRVAEDARFDGLCVVRTNTKPTALQAMLRYRDRLRAEALVAQHGLQAEWGDVLRDLDRLQEIQLEQDGKRLLLRTPTTGVAGKLFRAVGVAPPQRRNRARQRARRSLLPEPDSRTSRPIIADALIAFACSVRDKARRARAAERRLSPVSCCVISGARGVLGGVGHGFGESLTKHDHLIR
jgi:hypothetical protein